MPLGDTGMLMFFSYPICLPGTSGFPRDSISLLMGDQEAGNWDRSGLHTSSSLELLPPVLT